MGLIFQPAEPTTIPVQDSDDLFPVNRIFCIGKNYADHVREMGSDPSDTPPCVFMKPTGCLVVGDGDLPYPSATEDLHYEGELVVALSKGGKNLDRAAVEDAIFGYGAGLDMTRRDVQAGLKERRLPWDMAKSFDGCAAISALKPKADAGNPHATSLKLSVNGNVRQNDTTAKMIWPVIDALVHLSTLIELKPGDLLFTGTPEGVGQVVRGDRMDLAIEGVATLSVTLK
ncbi:fumarylacetoacetate hydrolase family protein [Thalassospira sp. SM2505]|uniref:Fumarylacetoacetate hydrolase n=1 Tax=Thalassospira profundimaris TaxID=502049 RepID=A0A367WWS6_9PROT|nr:fumarylacetoacetate hydrolase family protein [Thalassospira profundimaris]RCK45837.1 fumarylacetoacetate hydrolase [Thalassospira profundimaris]